MNPQAPRGAARTARQISNGFAPHSFARALGMLMRVTAGDGASAAGAHRVDEYLQATRLSVDTGRVDLEIDLTPGVAMASKVFAWIDTDGDGEISSAEGEAYGREMLRSVALKIDGRLAPVTLVEVQLPANSGYEPRRGDHLACGRPQKFRLWRPGVINSFF